MYLLQRHLVRQQALPPHQRLLHRLRTTTLPKAKDVVEDNITTYLAWDKNGCEHPNNPLSYKQYLEAVESGDWFGYQPSDCTNIPDDELAIVEEEIDDELDEEIAR